MSFQLPMPGLFVDMETGSASVGLPDEFLDATAAVRAEVLQQWLVEFSLLRNDAVLELFRAQTRKAPGAAHGNEVERFRVYCSSNGFDCPAEAALLADSCKGAR